MTVVTEGILGLLLQVSIQQLCEEMRRRGWKCDGSRGTFEPEAIEVWAHFGVTIDPKAVIRFEQSGGGYVDVPVSAIVEQFVSLPAPEANFAEVLNAAPPQGGAKDKAAPSGFEAELSALINRHSMEADSNTPDFLLARFLVEILHAFGSAVHWRDKHYQFNPLEMTLRGVNIGGRGPIDSAFHKCVDMARAAVRMDDETAKRNYERHFGPGSYQEMLDSSLDPGRIADLQLPPESDLGSFPSHPKSKVWDAINAYAEACGGDTSDKTVGLARMKAVNCVEQEIDAIVEAAKLRWSGLDNEPIGSVLSDHCCSCGAEFTEQHKEGCSAMRLIDLTANEFNPKSLLFRNCSDDEKLSAILKAIKDELCSVCIGDEIVLLKVREEPENDYSLKNETILALVPMSRIQLTVN